MFEPTDDGGWMVYRRAYGEATRLIEIARFDHGFGRDFAAGLGGNASTIVAEVWRRMGMSADRGAVESGVNDALAGRPPRW